MFKYKHLPTTLQLVTALSKIAHLESDSLVKRGGQRDEECRKATFEFSINEPRKNVPSHITIVCYEYVHSGNNLPTFALHWHNDEMRHVTENRPYDVAFSVQKGLRPEMFASELPNSRRINTLAFLGSQRRNMQSEILDALERFTINHLTELPIPCQRPAEQAA